ncbi:MAG: hypothetical protein ACYCW6_07905 [Candidatus Xenobia bacterium]
MLAPMARPALAQDDDGLQVGDVVVRLTAMEGPSVQLDFMKDSQTRTWHFTPDQWKQFLALFYTTARTDNYQIQSDRGLARDEVPMGQLNGIHFERFLDPDLGVEAILTDGHHTLAEFDPKHAYLFFERAKKVLPATR